MSMLYWRYGFLPFSILLNFRVSPQRTVALASTPKSTFSALSSASSSGAKPNPRGSATIRCPNIRSAARGVRLRPSESPTDDRIRSSTNALTGLLDPPMLRKTEASHGISWSRVSCQWLEVMSASQRCRGVIVRRC